MKLTGAPCSDCANSTRCETLKTCAFAPRADDPYGMVEQPKPVPPKEAVNHPAHYNVGKIEVIDAIEDWQMGFNDGNAVKYIARHAHKGKPAEDIKKAIWYLQRHLANLEKDSAARS